MAIDFKNLKESDLILNELYKGGEIPNKSSEAISKIMKCGNSGGFRKLKIKNNRKELAYCVLYTTGEDLDWPDKIDLDNKSVIYYGDNRNGDKEILQTKNCGNKFLVDIFYYLNNNEREKIVPIFIFQKEKKMNVKFKGLIVPGNNKIENNKQLELVYGKKNNKIYQNYKAHFTILDDKLIKREWLNDLYNGIKNSKFEPESWKKWKNGELNYLNNKSEETKSKVLQLPSNLKDLEMLDLIYNCFKNNNNLFSEFSMKLLSDLNLNIKEYSINENDILGKYKIEFNNLNILLDFNCYTKCNKIDTSIGIIDLLILISKMKENKFGVIVTTSYIDFEVINEIKNKQYPIISITGVNIIDFLKKKGITDIIILKKWLEENFY